MKDPVLHALYLKHYANKSKRGPLETCIRCGKKGKLGERKPYEGLCKQCRKGEYKVRTGLDL